MFRRYCTILSVLGVFAAFSPSAFAQGTGTIHGMPGAQVTVTNVNTIPISREPSLQTIRGALSFLSCPLGIKRPRAEGRLRAIRAERYRRAGEHQYPGECSPGGEWVG